MIASVFVYNISNYFAYICLIHLSLIALIILALG